MKKHGRLVMILLIFSLLSGCGFEPEKMYGTANVSPLVEQWREDVCAIASEYGLDDYVELILAIIAQESGGDAERYPDIMQSSESAGKSPNTITDPQESLRQGIQYLAGLIQTGEAAGVDRNTIIQAYNFGTGYITYIRDAYAGVHSLDAARTYSTAMASKMGWNSYGDVKYVEHVYSHIYKESMAAVNYAKMYTLMLEYEGVPYLYGGDSKAGIDCSAMTRRLYREAGITLPRTAQEQYDNAVHIGEAQAQIGDLVFFQGTYNTVNYITHVGIYAGNGIFFHAGGNQCQFSELSGYYKEHFVCFGRK